jgi:hypothetical protein
MEAINLQETLEKNWKGLAALHRQDLLWKSRHDDLLKYFKELRELYFAATGQQYTPAELSTNRYVPTDADREYLRSIGIEGL